MTCTPSLLEDLPDTKEPPRRYVSACVGLLARRGLLDAEFFAALGRARPRKTLELYRVMLDHTDERGDGTAKRPHRSRRLTALAMLVALCQIIVFREFHVLERVGTDAACLDAQETRYADAIDTTHEGMLRIQRLRRDIDEAIELIVEFVDDDSALLVWNMCTMGEDVDDLARLLNTLDLALTGVEAAEPRERPPGGEAPPWDTRHRAPDTARVDEPRADHAPPEPHRSATAPQRRTHPRSPPSRYEEDVSRPPMRGSVAELVKLGALYKARSARRPDVPVGPSALPGRGAQGHESVQEEVINLREHPSMDLLRETRTARFRLRDGQNMTAYCVDVDGRTTDVRTAQAFPDDPEIDQILRETVQRWRWPLFRDEQGKPIKTCRKAIFNLDFGR